MCACMYAYIHTKTAGSKSISNARKPYVCMYLCIHACKVYCMYDIEQLKGECNPPGISGVIMCMYVCKHVYICVCSYLVYHARMCVRVCIYTQPLHPNLTRVVRLHPLRAQIVLFCVSLSLPYIPNCSRYIMLCYT